MKDDSALTENFVRVIQKISDELPGSERYVMVHHPAFRVGKKPFVIVGMESSARKDVTLSINLGPEMQLTLLEDERFTRTPYIGQHGWVTVRKGDLDARELRGLVERSYRRIAGKKLVAQLDANGAPTKVTTTKAATKTATTKAKPDAAKKSAKKTASTKAKKTTKKKAATRPAS